jgi:uncharacterized protein with ParB-like and HNH nuclease domain
MNQRLENRIEANDTTINKLLKEQKFYIDYFQREYRWGENHIKTLIEDLTTTFLKSYKEGDKPEEVANYQGYYLGPIVFSINPETAKKSIIDGQQRITSITLLLIYLNNIQKDFDEDDKVPVADLIFSLKHRVKSFNMTDETREDCLKALFETGEYSLKEDDDETVANMLERYVDIENAFPEDIDENVLPYFIDWFTENVVVIEIKAYSDENAYTIFETMNDRGLNLTSTEMLKGYVLSKISDSKQRNEINDVWKKQMRLLHSYDKNADHSFFQAWFRGRYAVSIRPGKAGSENKDFELIGSRFHSWFKDNHQELFTLEDSDSFYSFFKEMFPFYVKWYLRCWGARLAFNANMPHLHYINYWGIAESLQDPLLLASVNPKDNDEDIETKLDLVARFIETFTVRRSINYKKFGQTAIKYTMFNIIKAIRNNSAAKLVKNLTKETEAIPQKWGAIRDFRLHGMNRKFVKHLLCRITSHLDNLVGKDINYASYHHPKGKGFEIEHIWADKYNEHKDEFDQILEFQAWRNSIGALILLPQGTNQSFNASKYDSKLKHYIKENTYAQTLNPDYYKKNPNFLKPAEIKSLKFKAHPEFKKSDVSERLKLVQRICEQIWTTDAGGA